jgi:hypothetical protein
MCFKYTSRRHVQTREMRRKERNATRQLNHVTRNHVDLFLGYICDIMCKSVGLLTRHAARSNNTDWIL